MIATCSNCSAQFQFDDSYIKPAGTKMRCARCHKIFTIYPGQKAAEDESGLDFTTEDNPLSDKPETSGKEADDFFLFSMDDNDFGADELDLNLDSEGKSSTGRKNLFDFYEERCEKTSRGRTDIDISFPDYDMEETEGACTFEMDLDFCEKEEVNWGDFDAVHKEEERPSEDLPSMPREADENFDFIFDDDKAPGQDKAPASVKMPGLITKDAVDGGLLEDDSAEHDLTNLSMETRGSPEFPTTGKSSGKAPGYNPHSLQQGTAQKNPFPGSGFEVDFYGASKPEASQKETAAIESIRVKQDTGAGKIPFLRKHPAGATKAKPETNIKKILRSLALFLVLFLLFYCGLYFVQKKEWINLPFDVPMPVQLTDLPLLNTFFPTQKIEAIPDPGDLHIHTLDVDLKFIMSERLGRLLVLSGKVRNAYPHSRKQIRLRARLFVDADVIRTRTVYAGNVIADENLALLPITEIENELNKPGGDRNSNENVAKNAEIPFMFIFADLPANLSGYEINVVSSQQAGR